MKRYIKASRDNGISDIEYFDLPNAYIHRIKNHIFNYNPEMIIEDDWYEDNGDFLEDNYSLQKIFVNQDTIVDYLTKAIDNCSDSKERNKLQGIVKYIQPEDDFDLADIYSQSAPYQLDSLDPRTRESLFSPKEFKNPKSAIIEWFKLGTKYPTCVCIFAKDNAYAKDLLQWVIDNEDEFRSLYNTYNVPYKLEYLINYCKRHINDATIIKKPGDQVDPFSLG